MSNTAPATPPFNVEIDFVGIFAIVPHTDGHQVAIVVPASDKDDRDCGPTYDGKTLYRHRWFIDYDPHQVPGTTSIPPQTRALWTISDCRGFRRITFACPGAKKLKIGNGLKYVANLEDVAPDYADILPKALEWKPPTAVAGQIMFDKGVLEPPPSSRKWIFPLTLSKSSSPCQPSLSHYIRLEFKNVTDFCIESRKSPGPTPIESLRLLPTKDQPVVKLSICNLCDVNPLRWKTKPHVEPDHDFRWYYTLSKKQNSLVHALAGLDLPVPHPSGKPAAVGQNCLEAQFKPAKFTI